MITFKEFLAESLWSPLKKNKQERGEKAKRVALKVAQFKDRTAPKFISINELDHNQKSIQGIADLYFYHNMQLKPTPPGGPHMYLPTKEVAHYVTYDREQGKSANLGMDKEAWEELEHSIQKNGIKVPIDIQISPGAYVDYLRTGQMPDKNSQDIPPVGLLTGNNRIVIAQKAGLEEVPVKFHYGNLVLKKDLKTVEF